MLCSRSPTSRLLRTTSSTQKGHIILAPNTRPGKPSWAATSSDPSSTVTRSLGSSPSTNPPSISSDRPLTRQNQTESADAARPNIHNTAAVGRRLTLRGRVFPFNILDDKIRDYWATRLRDLGCDYLMLDCLRPCLDALGLDEKPRRRKFPRRLRRATADAGSSTASSPNTWGTPTNAPVATAASRTGPTRSGDDSRRRTIPARALLHRLRPRRRRPRRTVSFDPDTPATHLRGRVAPRRQD